jgi:hypothetical protein
VQSDDTFNFRLTHARTRSSKSQPPTTTNNTTTTTNPQTQTQTNTTPSPPPANNLKQSLSDTLASNMSVPPSQARSQLAGYERTHFRDHHAAYETGADMEPVTQPLYARQAEVPRLPVPPLADTASMFLRSARPHVTAEEFATTEKLMADFLKEGGLGQQLQQRLMQRKEDKPNTSWFNEWWNDVAYLTYRDTVVW